MHNLLALILAALLADLVQCLTWAARWLLIWALCVVVLALYFFACLILIHLWCVWWA
jgi:hypothetical protein